MAYLIPENLRSRRDVPPGVARFAGALRDGLDDDVTVWYEPMFDVDGERPDLVILMPSFGIVVLEVLETRALALQGAEGESLVVGSGAHAGSTRNPLSRAREFARHLVSAVADESRLPPEERLPIAAGAVLPYVSYEASLTRELGDVLPRESCLFRGDVEAGAAGEGRFRSRISRLVGALPRDPLSDEAEKVYRALIHPDTVIGTPQLPFPTVAREHADDELRVLDRRQEALAKSLGVGHRVIRGAAGSGKTLVLTYRARLMAEIFPHHGVLVTCYTNSLAGRLRQQLKPWRNVTVKTLDSLMDEARRGAGISTDYQDGDRVEQAEQALQALDSHPESVGRFHHVLIDEAQDFPNPALRFAVRLLVDGSDSLLAVADPVQNIFRTRFTWRAAGIDAVGRTRWLNQSYRNTREILEYAHRFVTGGGDYQITSDPDPEDEKAITVPLFSERSGPIPLLLTSGSPQEEVVNIAGHCRKLLDRGVPPNEIAILYGGTFVAGFKWPDSIRDFFVKERLALFWATDPADRQASSRIGDDPSKIVLSTIHSAKGLEFRHVILCGFLDDKPPAESRVSRSLIYVGMTRATHELTLSASGKHPYLVDLEQI